MGQSAQLLILPPTDALAALQDTFDIHYLPTELVSRYADLLDQWNAKSVDGLEVDDFDAECDALRADIEDYYEAEEIETLEEDDEYDDLKEEDK